MRRCHSGPPTPTPPPPPLLPNPSPAPEWYSFVVSQTRIGTVSKAALGARRGQGGVCSNHNGHRQTQNDPEGTEHYRHGGSLVNPSLMYSLIHPGIQGASE